MGWDGLGFVRKLYFSLLANISNVQFKLVEPRFEPELKLSGHLLAVQFEVWTCSGPKE